MENAPNHRRLAILVGGGPAPGINGVIHSATIEAINNGVDVVGILDGFEHLMQGQMVSRAAQHRRCEPHPPARGIDPAHLPGQPDQS